MVVKEWTNVYQLFHYTPVKQNIKSATTLKIENYVRQHVGVISELWKIFFGFSPKNDIKKSVSPSYTSMLKILNFESVANDIYPPEKKSYCVNFC